MMRQPLEDGKLTISRAAASLAYLLDARRGDGLVAEHRPLPATPGRYECPLNGVIVTGTGVCVVTNYDDCALERTRNCLKEQWLESSHAARPRG
jgi:hypothetical protein